MTQAMVLEDLHWDTDAREALEQVAKIATDGVIRKVGYAESRRPGRKHGLCRVWKVAV